MESVDKQHFYGSELRKGLGCVKVGHAVDKQKCANSERDEFLLSGDEV